MSALTLGSTVRGFFEDYLQCQKGLRISTVRSYRDCLRLFLLFVADDVPRPLTRLRLADLTAERVRRFLNNLEEERHNHIRSRNQRLSALRVFFEYLARQSPELLCEAEYVAAIPTKPRRAPCRHDLGPAPKTRVQYRHRGLWPLRWFCQGHRQH